MSVTRVAIRIRNGVKKTLKLYGLLRNSRHRGALRKGVAAAIEHEPLLRSLACKYVVDIGANKGQFALVARACFQAAKIVSFEPLQRPSAIFREVFAGDANVQLHEVAIGPQATSTLIHVSHRDDSSSLLPIADAQNALFPGTAEARTESIKAGPLREFISSSDVVAPALLKLDVQGYELQALMGCEELLSSFSWVYVECSFLELYTGQALAHEIIHWLAQRHFTLAGVYNVTYTREGIAVQADFLFQKGGAGILGVR